MSAKLPTISSNQQREACGEPHTNNARGQTVPPSWRDIFSLLGLYLGTRLPFLFVVPMQQAPDEFAHYWVIKYLKQHLALPTMADVAAGGPSAVYGSLPQLGYLPHVAVSLLAPENEIALAGRFGSLLAGTVLLYAAYALGKEIFPRDRLFALALPLLVIFHPQLAFLHGYANSDATSSALSSLIILLTVKNLKQGLLLKRSILLGLLIGWLVLSKYAGLAVIPVVALCMVAAAYIHRRSIGELLVSCLAVGLAAAGVSGWWFVRNYFEFNKDVLGTETMYRSWALTFHRDLNYKVPASHILKNFSWWRMTYFSYCGMFGYMTVYMWRPVYIAYALFLLTSAVAGACAGFKEFGARARLMFSDRKQLIEPLVWLSLGGFVAMNLAAMVVASTKNLGGPQGRYLFTTEIAITALYLGGLFSLGPRAGKYACIAFVTFNAIVCVGAWIMLLNMYGVHWRPL